MQYTWHGPRNAAGIPHGRGTWVFENGGRTEAECVNGLFQGPGVETAPDGSRLEGAFVDGLMQGPVVETSPNGTRFEGVYVNAKWHGRSVGTRPDGTRFERQFVHGSLVSHKELGPAGGMMQSAGPVAPMASLSLGGATPQDSERFDSVAGNRRVLAALQQLLRGTQIGKGGRDQAPGAGRYSTLAVAHAWRFRNPDMAEDYAREATKLGTLLKRGLVVPPVELAGCMQDPRVVADLGEEGLRLEVNEALLLHGVKTAATAQLILENGMSEKYAGSGAGSAFGRGAYLAEDAGKIDQYTECERGYNRDSMLHQSLFTADDHHKGDLHYLVVCRALLGRTLHTRDGKTNQDGGGGLFATSERMELVPIPTNASFNRIVPHHTLVVEVGEAVKRFREFVIFHSDRILPIYLVAYQRQ